MEDEELYEQIDCAIREKGQELFLPLKERLWLRSSLYDSFRRLDILQELLDDRNVTEIMVNGAGKIFIERKDGTALWERRFETAGAAGGYYPADRRACKPGGKCVFSHCRCPSGGWLPRSYRAASGCAGRSGSDHNEVSGTDHGMEKLIWALGLLQEEAAQFLEGW